MYAKNGATAAQPGTSVLDTIREAADQANTAITRAMTDRAIDLKKYQEEVTKRIGRALTPQENALWLSRIDPNRAADITVQERLLPAVEAVGEDKGWLEAYLDYHTAIDTANSMGQKAANAVLSRRKRSHHSDAGRHAVGQSAGGLTQGEPE